MAKTMHHRRRIVACSICSPRFLKKGYIYTQLPNPVLPPSPKECGVGLLAVSLTVNLPNPPVLLIADLFHPVGGSAAKLLLNGDMGHCRGLRGAMPMLFTWRNPNNVARENFLDRSATPGLRQTATSCHDQSLP
jgi:hypothetical protein